MTFNVGALVVWFRTRRGLTSFDCGNATVLGHKYGNYVGVVIYTERAKEVRLNESWLGRRRKHSGLSDYLVCMQQSPTTAQDIAKCLERIEASIRANDPICDLSDLGCDEAWNVPAWGIVPKWSPS
jgi:hypothetical protein